MGGIFSKKVVKDVMPTSTVIQRLDECVIPDDKETMLDYFEMIDEACETEKGAMEYKENRGVLITMKVMKRMLDDPELIRLALTVFKTSLSKKPVIMDFIQFGGIDFLKKVAEDHQSDEFLNGFVPVLLREVLAIGANAAMTEINEEMNALQLCHHCQEILERNKRKGEFGLVEIKIPTASERVNRIVMFMENYRLRKDVQLMAIDALIMYAKNPDCKHTIDDTDALENIAESLKTFIVEPDMVWRICVCLMIVAKFSSNLANQTAELNIHDLLAENYDTFSTETRVQQQILWVYNSILSFPLGRRALHISKTCMDLFKRLLEKREIECSNLKQASKKDALKPFKVIIPHQIRAFVRETKGLLRGERPPDAVDENAIAQQVKERKTFDPKPRYSTIDADFKEGESGLIEEHEHLKGKKGLELVQAQGKVTKDALKDEDFGLTYGKKGGPKIFTSY